MRLCSRLCVLGLVVLAGLLQTSPSHATTMRTASIVDLIDLADSILIGEIVSIEDGFDSMNLPYSDITMNVVEDLSGGKTGLRTFRQFGLKEPRQLANGMTALSVTPAGFPIFATEEKVVLFLYKKSPMNSMQTTVGLTQGKFTIDGQGMVSNAIDNTNLFRGVGAQTDRMPESAQKLVKRAGGKIDDATFLSFVREAVEKRWVEEGVLYHAN